IDEFVVVDVVMEHHYPECNSSPIERTSPEPIIQSESNYYNSTMSSGTKINKYHKIKDSNIKFKKFIKTN
ncbi:MAG: hypothetical protein PHO80_01285, partial [Candidatus Gracilibacteria bacterium]|nr:hypothetical protein [Candidatus Gracilibacteria bacterium]